MELNLNVLLPRYRLKPKGVINIGSHYFQERELFESVGIERFVLIEPQPHAFKETEKRAVGLNDCLLFNCAVSDKEGTFEMYCDDISVNLGASSSLLKPELHLEKFPHVKFNRTETVNVCKLDNLDFDKTKYDIIFIDVQGNELNTFKGATETLKHIDCIFAEVNFQRLYEDCCLVYELDEFLALHNFVRKETGRDIGGYSDAMYLKIK